jgi:Holliday junction resolvase
LVWEVDRQDRKLVSEVKLRGKVDRNQAEIVKALRQVGASVLSLANMGRGCPDILVGFRDRNYLIEIKDGSKPPSKRELTNAEAFWYMNWRGTREIAYSVADALRIIGVALIPEP